MKDSKIKNEQSIQDSVLDESEKLTSKTSQKPTYVDVKDGDGDVFFDPEEYVYLSDGVYIHKDECWF